MEDERWRLPVRNMNRKFLLDAFVAAARSRTQAVENMSYTFKDCDEFVDTIREWLKKQLHLPQNINDQLIRRFLLCSNLSIEKTKQLIDLNYTLRSQSPELFANRDPFMKDIEQIFNIIDYCPLPKQTEEQYKLFIYRLNNNDPDKFQYSDAVKVFFMVADLRMSFDMDESMGEVPIFDMAGITMKHLTRITLPLLKKYMVFTQEAHPVRLKQIHILNTAPFLDKCLALVKPFMKNEVANLLHFHAPNSHTLFDYIPRELIPEDYGGTLDRSMDMIKMEWRNKVTAYRDFYMDPERWLVNETKRSSCGNVSVKNLFGMEGSFRSLTID